MMSASGEMQVLTDFKGCSLQPAYDEVDIAAPFISSTQHYPDTDLVAASTVGFSTSDLSALYLCYSS